MSTRRFLSRPIVAVVTPLLLGSLIAGCSTQSTDNTAAAHKSNSAFSKVPSVEVAPHIKALAAKVNKHWPAIDKVWPGADYTKHVAVVFDLDESNKAQRVWAVDTNGARQVSEKEVEGLTAPMPGGYSPGSLEGRSAILLSTSKETREKDADASELYRFASHELVHFYHQQDLAPESEGEGRAQDYPLQTRPRLLRQMIYHNLVQAVDNEGESDKFLRRAAYWHNQWKTEFPEEYKAVAWTDIAEGHARYVENLATIETKNITSEQRRDEEKKQIQRDTVFGAADVESYEIGYVAGILLDVKKPDWKEHFLRSNKTPADALLGEIDPLEENPNPQVEKSVKEDLKATNDDLAKAIEPIDNAEADKTIPYLIVDTSKVKGSYGGKNFIRHRGKEITTGFFASYQSKGGSADFQDFSVITKENHIIVPLPKDTQVKNGRLNIENESMRIKNLEVTETRDNQSRLVYRATAEN